MIRYLYILTKSNMQELLEKLIASINDLPKDTALEPKEVMDKIDCVDVTLDLLQDALEEYKTEKGTEYASAMFRLHNPSRQLNDPPESATEFEEVCDVFGLDSIELGQQLSLNEYDA